MQAKQQHELNWDDESLHYIQTQFVSPKCDTFAKMLISLHENQSLDIEHPNVQYMNGLLLSCHLNIVEPQFQKCLTDSAKETPVTISSFDHLAQNLESGQPVDMDSAKSSAVIFNCLSRLSDTVDQYVKKVGSMGHSRFGWNERYVDVAMKSNNDIKMSQDSFPVIYDKANASVSPNGACHADYSSFRIETDEKLKVAKRLKYSKCLTADLCSTAVLQCMNQYENAEMSDGEMFEACVSNNKAIADCLGKLDEATRFVFASTAHTQPQ